MEINKQTQFDKKDIRKEYFRYLLPTVVGMVSHCCYCLADVFFVGIGVGSNGLAALNIALPIFTFFSAFSIMIGVGAAITISICRGEENYENIDKIFTLAMVTIAVLGITIGALSTIYLREVCYFFGATDLIVEQVMDYLKPIVPLTFFYMLSSSLCVIVRSDGNPRLVMVAGTTGNLLNIVLDYIFVMKMDMSMFGAGLATILGPCVCVGILMLHFIKRQNKVFLTRTFFSGSLLLRMVKNGVGSGVLEVSSGFVIFLFNIVLIRVSGEQAVAIFAIISNIGYIAKGIYNGMAQAAQPIISVSYGAKQYGRMRIVNTYAMLTALIFSLVTYVIILLFPGNIIAMFLSSDPAVLAIGIPAIMLYFLSFPFTGINTILMYYFQSIERVAHTTTMAMMRGVILVSVSLFILAKLFGLNGVWLALFVSEFITFVCFYPVKLNVDKKFMPLQ